MYYHNHHQGKSILSSERNPFLRENGTRDSGLILSTDAKPRLKWTSDLHERFVEAVNQLGGGDKATPKTIKKVMGIPGLTLYHLKSHLQKYRLSKNLNGQANNSLNKTKENIPEADKSQSESLSIGPQPSMNPPISDALQMQIEVQRRLQEQLETQGKYLQTILEKAQETLGRQNIEATKAFLRSAEYPGSSFLEPNEQMQTTYAPNSSLESCLTLSEGAHKDSKMFENRLGLIEEPFFHRMELTWTKEEEEGLRENKRPYLPKMVSNAEPRTSSSRRSPGRLSIGMGLQEHRGGSSKDGEGFKLETQTGTELNLNIHDENYGTRRPKQFDLN